MTIRISNTVWVTVKPPVPLENTGWEFVILSPDDWATVIARINTFSDMSYGDSSAEQGSGSITLDAGAPVLTEPLPSGIAGTILDREYLWKVYENGAFRGEWLGQDVEKDVVAGEDGGEQVTIAGQGTLSVLQWGVMVPMLAFDDEALTDAFVSKDFLGVHAATALVWLIGHIQGRGGLMFLDLTFDEYTDSKGQPWTDLQDVSVSPGETPLDLLQRFSDSFGWEFTMMEGFRLFISQDSVGSHRESEIKFFIGGDQKSHTYKSSTRTIANHIYTPAADGSMATAVGTSDATPHIREGWAEGGSETSATAAAAVAESNLEMFQNKLVGRTLSIVAREGRIPFDDFGINDWVTVENGDKDPVTGEYQTEVVQVSSLSIGINSNTEVTYELTVMTKFETVALRLTRLLDKMGGSALGGTSSTPISSGSEAQATVAFALLKDVHLASALGGDVLTYSQAGGVFPVTLGLDYLKDVDTATVAPVSGQVLKWNGIQWVPGVGAAGPTTLATQTDVTVVGLANGQVLVWNSTTGKWTPATPSSGVTTLAALTDVITTGIASGKVLTWNGTKWAPATPATVITALAGLTTDVDTTGAVSGKVLAYNGTKWVPTTPTGGGTTALAGLTTDVDTSGVVSGKVLGFNGTKWVPVSQTGGGGALPIGGAVGDALRKNSVTDGDALWTSGGVFYENGYTPGKTYLPGQIMLRNGILWLCVTSNMTDPLNSGSASTTTGVDGTAFTRNNCASVDTTNHVVTLINNAGSAVASVISNETFIFATPLTLKWRGSTTTVADALAIGIVSSTQSATVATTVEALPSFYGVVWDVFNNLLKCYVAGVVLADTMALASDTNDDVWEIRYAATSISLYSSAGLLIKTWTVGNYAAMGATFRPAAGARTGGSAGVFKIYGSPVMPGTASDWVSVGKAVVGAPATVVQPVAIGDLVTASATGTQYTPTVVGVTAATVIDANPANQASNAFDGNSATYWHSTNAMPQWIAAQFSAIAKVVSVSIRIYTFSANRSPRDFMIQGSSDGTTWVDLTTYTGITWLIGQTQSFAVTTTTAYLHYRIYISASNGDNYQTIPEIVFTAAMPGATTLPVAATAGKVLTSDPTAATGMKWDTATGGGASTLDSLTDVATAGAVSGKVLGYTGTQWEPVTPSGGSGGSSDGMKAVWTKRLDASGMADLTGWTSRSGTWTSGGAYGVNQTSTLQDSWLEFNTDLGVKARAVQCTVRITADGTGLGVGFYSSGAWAAGGLGIGLQRAGAVSKIWWDRYGVGGSTFTMATSLALDTDYVLSVYQSVVLPTLFDVYVDHVYQVTITAAGAVNTGRVGLYSRTETGWIRNVTVWTGELSGSNPETPVVAPAAGIGDRRWNVPVGWTSFDEFNNASLDAAWVRVDKSGGTARAVWTEAADVLSVFNNGEDAASELHAMMRPLSGVGGSLIAGDAFVTHLSLNGSNGAYVMGGLVLADGVTSGAGTQLITLSFTNNGALSVDTRVMTNYQVAGAQSTTVGYPHGPLYERLVFLGGTTWRTDISPDGVSWVPGTTVSCAITPTHVGVHCSSWGSGIKGVSSYEFIRRVAGVT